MNDIVSIDKIRKMMGYLGIKSYVIPHYNLPMPPAASGWEFRSEKIFILELDGSMTYKGYGQRNYVADLYRTGLPIPDAFLSRAYVHLSEDVNRKLKQRENSAAMSNIRELLIKFNGLEFLEGCQ